MRNFLLMKVQLDVIPLLLALRRKPELWREDTYLRDYPEGPFGEVESIILRFPPRTVHATEEAFEAHAVTFDQHENFDQPAYADLPEARPLVAGVMAYVQGERLGRVFINKIGPGGKIFPHADTPAHAEYWDRFHICLAGPQGADFRCGDETVNMRMGELWWFQNLLEHEVLNNSTEDRIHVVIDIRQQRAPARPAAPKLAAKK